MLYFLTLSSWVYDKDICNICRKKSIYNKKNKNTVIKLITVTTEDGCQAIETASRNKNPSLYAEIHDLDLVAKEFKYHRCCYVSFTFGCTSETTSQESTTETIGNFEGVKSYIESIGIYQKRVVSMKGLQNIYGGRQDAVYRGKLKERILREYSDQLVFFQSSHNIPEVIVSKEATLEDHVDTLVDKNMYITKAASYIQKYILDFAQKVPGTNWPPIAEELFADEQQPPESVTMFLTELLKTPHKSGIGNHCMRLSDRSHPWCYTRKSNDSKTLSFSHRIS